MVAFGAPFFSGIGEGVGRGCGVSVGVCVTLGVGVVVSSGGAVADGVGDSLGARVGGLFFRFAFVAAVGLVAGVGDVFFGLGEALEERFNAQDATELRDDRDAAAFTNERDVVVEGLAQRALGRLTDQ